MTALVFNIQRFSLHDGDGIRTTIFFKGCPLSCKWCHNPESQLSEPQTVFYQKKCRGCQHCVQADCVYGAREIAGKPYSPSQLIAIAERDAEFYRTSGGGVTLSGGEVMTQPQNFLVELLRGLKQKGINTAIDTCGHAPFETFENVLPYVNTFLYDIKFADNARHLQFTGQGNELILSNLQKLSQKGAKLEIRIPVIEGINSDDAEMDKIMSILSNIRVEKIRLLPYHSIGRDKYTHLGMNVSDEFHAPSTQRMNELTEKFKQNGLPVV